MPLIVDTLCTETKSSPYFTVNTATSSVAIFQANIEAVNNSLYNSSLLLSKFAKGDNFTIISAGYILPLSFKLFNPDDSAGNLSCISLDFQAYDGTFKNLYELSGGTGQCIIPIENSESFVNCFCDCRINNLLTNNFSLKANIVPMGQKIDMTGVPAAYNTMKIYIKLFAKVAHQLPLTA